MLIALNQRNRRFDLRRYENLKGSGTLAVPLYQITSSEKLKELVIDPLLAVQEKERGVT